jgi:hypothetical protein
MFEHVNIEDERALGWDWSEKGSELLKLRLQVTQWLEDAELTCPIKQLQSAYKDDGSGEGEALPYTNVTSDFEGTLDYIFFGKQSFEQTERLYVPTSYDELNAKSLRNGHLLPSDTWPSDHLAIGATLSLQSTDITKKSAESKHPLPPPTAMFCAPTGAPPSAIPPQLMQLATGAAAPQQGAEHPKKCDCGCVPNILSLFEMAELRKKARERREAEKEK